MARFPITGWSSIGSETFTARPFMEARRVWILEGELPEMAARLKKLERRLAELEARLAGGDRA